MEARIQSSCTDTRTHSSKTSDRAQRPCSRHTHSSLTCSSVEMAQRSLRMRTHSSLGCDTVNRAKRPRLQGWAMEKRWKFGAWLKQRYFKLGDGKLVARKYMPNGNVSSILLNLRDACVDIHPEISHQKGQFHAITIKLGRDAILWNGSLGDNFVMCFDDEAEYYDWVSAISRSICPAGYDVLQGETHTSGRRGRKKLTG